VKRVGAIVHPYLLAFRLSQHAILKCVNANEALAGNAAFKPALPIHSDDQSEEE
jgi:hypothetical protein